MDATDNNGKKDTYNGYIEEIWELDYGPNFKVPLFRCQCVKLSGGGVTKGEYVLTLLRVPIYVPQAHRSCSFSLRVFPQGLSIHRTSVLLCLTKH